MHEVFRVPIGLRLSQAARTVSRAFDDVLDEAGGTLPVWLILLNLKIGTPASQRELADADLDHLSDLLGQLAANAGATEDGTPPWAGLAESRRQK